MTETAEPASKTLWLSRAEAAEYVGAPNQRWMRRAVDQGVLVGHKRNRLVRFFVPELDAYIAANRIDNSGAER